MLELTGALCRQLIAHSLKWRGRSASLMVGTRLTIEWQEFKSRDNHFTSILLVSVN